MWSDAYELDPILMLRTQAGEKRSQITPDALLHRNVLRQWAHNNKLIEQQEHEYNHGHLLEKQHEHWHEPAV